MLSAPEEGPKLSRLERIEQSGLTVEDVEYLLDQGVKDLPLLETGTLLHGSNEAKNRKARIEYLKDALGIEADKIPNPTDPEKMLQARLVSDVLVDLITLCQTVKDVPKDTDSQPLIDVFNAMLNFRVAKGKLIELKLADGKTSLRKFGLTKHYSPGRSDNPTRPGYFTEILETLETALENKNQDK